jgi:hypothetical protein
MTCYMNLEIQVTLIKRLPGTSEVELLSVSNVNTCFIMVCAPLSLLENG